MSRGSFVLRTALGGIMMGHGLQKLKGSFGGPGLEGTEQITKSLGLHPAKQQAWAVALSETVGGGLTAAGLFSPLGPSMVIGTMAVAVKKVHLDKGFWLSRGGYEFNLLITAAAFSIAAQGPGPISLDGIFGKQRAGLHWAVMATALGLGAAAATLKVADAMAPPPGSDETLDAGTDDAGTDATSTGDASTADEPLLLDDEA